MSNSGKVQGSGGEVQCETTHKSCYNLGLSVIQEFKGFMSSLKKQYKGVQSLTLRELVNSLNSIEGLHASFSDYGSGLTPVNMYRSHIYIKYKGFDFEVRFNLYDIFDRKAKPLPWVAPSEDGTLVDVDELKDIALFDTSNYNLAVMYSDTKGFSRDSVDEMFAPKEREITGALGEGYAMIENSNVSGSSYTAHYFGGYLLRPTRGGIGGVFTLLGKIFDRAVDIYYGSYADLFDRIYRTTLAYANRNGVEEGVISLFPDVASLISYPLPMYYHRVHPRTNYNEYFYPLYIDEEGKGVLGFISDYSLGSKNSWFRVNYNHDWCNGVEFYNWKTFGTRFSEDSRYFVSDKEGNLAPTTLLSELLKVKSL